MCFMVPAAQPFEEFMFGRTAISKQSVAEAVNALEVHVAKSLGRSVGLSSNQLAFISENYYEETFDIVDMSEEPIGGRVA